MSFLKAFFTTAPNVFNWLGGNAITKEPTVPPTIIKNEGKFQNKFACPVATTPPTTNDKPIISPTNVDFPKFNNPKPP